ncbi:MAG: hypothetical protein HYT11_01970 [Candidatus Levybacteria bacterium]|nr:hypothetical protein [Candidatus Levybacteria bacterium]
MGDWKTAILLNQLLLKENPNDIDTLNRLAYAFASTGNTKKAKDIYNKVLNLDVQNPVALRCLKKLNVIGKHHMNGHIMQQMNNIFIEEPGKTKVIELVNIADPKVISQLRCGEILIISLKRMKIFVLDLQKRYIGMLPDDISKRLIRFLNGGNTYAAYVKTTDNSKVMIFLRETRRVPKFKNQPSFTVSERTKLTIPKNAHLSFDESEDKGE